MRILGVNISHDASVALIENGQVLNYYEEGRHHKNRVPHLDPTDYMEGTDYVFRCLSKIDLHKVDKLVIASCDRRGWIDEVQEKQLIQSIEKQVGKGAIYYPEKHHVYHAMCGMYFSNFNDAICITMDGGGAQLLFEQYPFFSEVEGVFYIKNNKVEHLYSRLSGFKFTTLRSYEDKPFTEIMNRVTIGNIDIDMRAGSANKFESLAWGLGFNGHVDAGKVMGLAPYGNPEHWDGQGLAARLQKETENDTVQLIEKAINYKQTKNIVLSGGYALNCTNNYKYTEQFPDYNFFVDPVAYDGGLAIGCALYEYYAD